jgi:lysylphosphatidylglycerol synthetase-like protein (DUF2156 family)
MRLLRKSVDGLLERSAARLPPCPLDLDARLALFRRFGDFSIAYSTAVQPGLRHFGDTDGYIAYGAKMGSVMALGDPVAEAGRKAGLIADFVEAGGQPCFAEISQETAAILAPLGYRIARMGIDTVLDLDSYDFNGGTKKKLRYATTWLDNNGYRVVEENELPDVAGAVAALSDEWRRTRIVSRREMAFINRPFPEGPDPPMRRFLLQDADGRLVALVYLDPLYRDGRPIGYMTAFKRKLPDATAYAELGLTKHIAELFKAEGLECLMLGPSPLAGLGPSGFAESATFRWLLARLYASRAVNDRVFNVRGHADLKRRFRGREVQRYFAWRRGSPYLHFIAMLRLCKAF